MSRVCGQKLSQIPRNVRMQRYVKYSPYFTRTRTEEASYGPVSIQSVAMENVDDADFNKNLAFVVLSRTAICKIRIFV